MKEDVPLGLKMVRALDFRSKFERAGTDLATFSPLEGTFLKFFGHSSSSARPIGLKLVLNERRQSAGSENGTSARLPVEIGSGSRRAPRDSTRRVGFQKKGGPGFHFRALRALSFKPNFAPIGRAVVELWPFEIFYFAAPASRAPLK